MNKYFRYNHRVRFFECDPAGIIFFGNVYHMAHIGFEEFLLHIDVNLENFSTHKFLLPIVHSEADYIKPLKFNDFVTIEIFINHIGKHSFSITYQLTNYETKDICAIVKTTHVVVDKDTFKKVPIYSSLKSKLYDFLIEKEGI